jgi:YidC/Oxa1 family membrane protein insertase
MTDMRRTVLWVVFLASLFMLWDGWQKHNGHPSFFAPPPKPVATAPAGPTTPASAASPAGTATAVAGAAGAVAAVAGEKVTIRTDVLTVTLDSLGGDVTRVELPKYAAAHLDPSLFDPLLQAVGIRKKPEVDLGPTVLLDAAHGYKAQSGLVSSVAGEQLPTHSTPMTLVSGERELKDGADAVSVRFESPEVGGVKLVKTYTFKRGDYVIDVKNEITNVGDKTVTPSVYLQLVRDASAAPGGSGYYSTFTGPAVYNGKYHKVDFKDIDKDKVDLEKKANDGWVGMVQHYFASAWIHNETGPREFSVYKVQGTSPQQYAAAMTFPLAPLAAGATTTQSDKLFVGPQEENDLASIAPGLELVKDYGIFAVISKPLFWLMDHLHKMIGNWGWAIIALVLLLKVAFYWLNAKAYMSMGKMKAINPRIQAMRERLKDKPQEMQQEMMRIYKEEKVNPIGGCLPVFVQMPVFIGLYWVLLSSVEMRGAPWLGWIHDLSVPDPFFILPLLMTISSLFQVWLQPTPPDPTQAKMMWFMPLAFSFMFFSFPAGLTLYYVVNNVLSIAQQWVINKRLGVLNT